MFEPRPLIAFQPAYWWYIGEEEMIAVRDEFYLNSLFIIMADRKAFESWQLHNFSSEMRR